jgi:hypothetical protein
MEKIFIEGTNKAPLVNFDHEKGLIELKGRSLLEDATNFYLPLTDWLNEYIDNPREKTVVNFEFEYFNTSCSKWLITLTKQLKTLYEKNQNLVINWYYEDDDVLEYGEVIRDLVDMPMNMLQK